MPANFDLVQRAVLVETARRAGLDVRRVLNEPTAAALTYGLNREENAIVLIFDLGGGTLDVTLIEVGNGVVEVKATCGDNHLGGDDWDQRIVQHLLHRVRDRHGVDLTQDVPARQRLQEAAEAAKVELSSASTATIRLPFLTSTAGSPVHLDETLTRTEFSAAGTGPGSGPRPARPGLRNLQPVGRGAEDVLVPDRHGGLGSVAADAVGLLVRLKQVAQVGGVSATTTQAPVSVHTATCSVSASRYVTYGP